MLGEKDYSISFIRKAVNFMSVKRYQTLLPIAVYNAMSANSRRGKLLHDPCNSLRYLVLFVFISENREKQFPED